LEDKNLINETFLVGFGTSILFKDIISFLHKITDKKSQIKEIDPSSFHKVVGIGNFVADTSKINNLGWKPKVGYKEGVKRIVDRYQKLA